MGAFSIDRLARLWLNALRLGVLFALASAAAHPLPGRTVAYKSVRLYGTEYVDVREFGHRVGLTSAWIVTGKKLRLQSKWTKIDFTVDSLEVWLNGLRLFLGEPVVARAGSLYVGRLDAEAMLGAIVAPRAIKPVPGLRTIVIDPGHGGNDPGNQNLRLKLSEEVHTLDVARRLERLLKAQGFRVILTRSSDRRVELEDRTEIARKAKADLFISIHFNAVTDRRVAGTETYVMPPRYQRSSPQAERDRRMVTTAHPSNRFDLWNILLGYKMHRQLVENLGLDDRGLKRFRYSVLRSISCPAVLVEAAFLSNDQDARKVSSATFRQNIAAAIAAGVKAYSASLERLRAPQRL